LKSLLDLRIKFLIESTYTNDQAQVSDIFPKKQGKSSPSAIDYILERVTSRPRDAIKYLNLCIEAARGKVRISFRNIEDAEQPYSRERLEAAIDDWADNYPELESVTRLLNGRPVRFSPTARSSDELLAVMVDQSDTAPWLRDITETYTKLLDSGEDQANSYAQRKFSEILYEVGIIGWVRGKGRTINQMRFSFIDEPLLSASDFHGDPELVVHRAFRKELGVE